MRYVLDGEPGITRRRFGRGFAFYLPTGDKLPRGDLLDRVRGLAVPPAYEDVWICPDDAGHLQATGRDDRGRKQYRYHEQWDVVRGLAKFAKLSAFARTLPRLRRTVARDLRRTKLPRRKVLAACVRLLDATFIRVGNAQYATENGSFGLTTLQDDHAEFGRGVVRFAFTGKGGLEREIEVADAKLAKIVKQCRDLPGQELLQYLEPDGTVRDIGSGDVNAYLHDIAGDEFTAKDFRTWHGTVLAATHLSAVEPASSKTARNRQFLTSIDHAAERLGNTRAVCRKNYVDPRVEAAFEADTLIDLFSAAKKVRGLSRDESSTLHLLEHGSLWEAAETK